MSASKDSEPSRSSTDPRDGQISSSEKQGLDALARFYEREESDVSPVQAGIERISSFFGSPTYFAFAVIFIICWVLINTWGDIEGWSHVDSPPFYYLQGLVSANALILTIAVLIRQNRMAQLAQHRAHLDLQINLMTEKKVSKMLEVMHEERRGAGGSKSTGFPGVDELVTPADPEALLEAIKRRDADPDARSG